MFSSHKESYSEVLKKDIKSATKIFKEILDEDKIEKRKIKSTENNLIIYGIEEFMDETN